MSRSVDRRSFLQSALGLVFAGPILFSSLPMSEGLGFQKKSKYLFSPSRSLGGQLKSVLFRYNLNSGATDHIELDHNLAHQAFLSRENPENLLVIEDGGTKISIINFETLKVARIVEAAPGCVFGGHGIHHGNFFFTVEMQKETKRGQLVRRNSATYEILAVTPTYGFLPHDIKKFSSAEFAIINSRSPPSNMSSVALVHADSADLRELILAPNRDVFFRHCVLDSKGNLGVSSRGPRPTDKMGLVPSPFLILNSKRRADFFKPAASFPQMSGGNTIDTMRGNYFLTTYQNIGGVGWVGLWNSETGDLISKILFEGEQPNAVTYAEDQKKIFIRTLQDNLYSVDSQEPFQKKLLASSFGGWAHLFLV